MAELSSAHAPAPLYTARRPHLAALRAVFFYCWSLCRYGLRALFPRPSLRSAPTFFVPRPPLPATPTPLSPYSPFCTCLSSFSNATSGLPRCGKVAALFSALFLPCVVVPSSLLLPLVLNVLQSVTSQGAVLCLWFAKLYGCETSPFLVVSPSSHTSRLFTNEQCSVH